MGEENGARLTPALLAARERREWPEPIPLENPGPTLPPFPLHAFPPALQDLCGQAAGSVGCPVDYPAAHALAVAAGAVGASFDLRVKRGYHAPSNLWVCVVAPPGSGKSPAVAPILAPVYQEHARRLRTPGEEQRPVYVSDVTVEKLAGLLNDNPRGLLMAWDEMAGWLTSFNQYKAKGAGSDRSHYLSIWDGRAVKVDRKGKDSPPVFVRRPRLSVVGGIQPDVLDELRAGPSDGLFDRMLFAYPPDPGMVVETWAEVDDAPCAAWGRALQWLWERPTKVDVVTKEESPHVVALNDDARPTWQGWTEELAGMAARPEAPPYFRSVGAKISGYAARLALVVHLLREAYGESIPQGVGREDMLRGVALADYFLKHADRVHRAAGRDATLKAAKAVLSWAAGFKADRWARSDAWASLRRNSLFAEPDDLDAPLRLLELHRIVRSDEAGGNGSGRGRKRVGGVYELNPALRNGVAAEVSPSEG